MMKSTLSSLLILCFALGFAACGGGNNDNDIASVEIIGSTDPLVPRGTQTFTAVAKDSAGNVMDDVEFTWTSENDRFLEVAADSTVKAQQTTGVTSSTVLATGIYPISSVNLTVLARSLQSGLTSTTSLSKLVVAPINNGNIMRMTDNLFEDNWGNNNNWPTTARDQILWVRTEAINIAVVLADTDNNQTPMQNGVDDVDFIALGSDGFLTNGIMATWRRNLSNTFVDDGSGSPDDLGALTQEENAVADGCLYFREGLPNDDIWQFTFSGGLDEIFTDGQSKGPVMTSQCQAAWLQEDGALFDLVFFDGSSVNTVAQDLPFAASFSMRNGRVVYSQNNDVFLYDSTMANPQAVNITNSPGDIENFVKTDGNSILIYRVAGGITNQIVLYDIETGDEQIISTTANPKDGESLQIDLKQAIWTEGGTDLFFFNGESTSEISLPFPLNMTGQSPYIADGTVVWVANDGDDEIYIMK